MANNLIINKVIFNKLVGFFVVLDFLKAAGWRLTDTRRPGSASLSAAIFTGVTWTARRTAAFWPWRARGNSARWYSTESCHFGARTLDAGACGNGCIRLCRASGLHYHAAASVRFERASALLDTMEFRREEYASGSGRRWTDDRSRRHDARFVEGSR